MSDAARTNAWLWTPRTSPAPGDAVIFGDRTDGSPEHVGHVLDSPAAVQAHSTLLGHFVHELDAQAANRAEMALDEDFYDHIQFTEEEIATLRERGQDALVFNMVHTTVNWLLGTQRRAPMDYRILPRKQDGALAADRKTQLVKHVDDVSNAEFEWSLAFSSQVRAGLGWMEAALGGPDDGARVIQRYENWRYMLHDSTALRYDLQDARYLFRAKWIDADIARSLWPHRHGVIDAASRFQSTGYGGLDDLGDDAMDALEDQHFWASGAGHGRGHFDAYRPRLRVIEAWFRRVIPNVSTIRGGQFDGEIYDPWSPGHHGSLVSGDAVLSTRPRMVTHVALMTDSGLLDMRVSPYRHNRYPFTPVWGLRRARDGAPYGIIRGIRDIQRDANKRFSKTLHHLSTTRVVAEEGTFSDPEEARNEAARPDAMLFYRHGKPAPLIQTDMAVAQAHMELLSLDAQMIQRVAGVTDENLGRKTNATSGIAIQRRQDQGALTTAIYFDHLRQSRILHGEKLLVLVETAYSDEDVIRVTDARGNPDWQPINDGAPENAIADYKADFVVSHDDWRATHRQAQAEQLFELYRQLAPTAPDLVIGSLDLLVEALDVPKRDELVKRIRRINGQSDPDADPNNPDEETLAAERKAAEEAELVRRDAEASIAEKEARARKISAEADKLLAGLTTDNLAQLRAAIDAALALARAPAVAPAADRMLTAARASAVPVPPVAPTMPQPAMGATPMAANPGAPHVQG